MSVTSRSSVFFSQSSGALRDLHSFPTRRSSDLVPDIAVVEFAMVGFCRLEVNPFGPLHEYVAPLMFEALSWIVAPAQYGPVLDAVGALGIGLTVTVVAADIVLAHPEVVT